MNETEADDHADGVFDVAVVGAGPAGLAAALALADAGAHVALLAPPGVPEDFRTSALFGTSVDLLKRLGLIDRLREKAAALRRMRLVDDTHRLIRAPEVVFAAREIGLDLFGYNFENRHLLAALDAGRQARAGKIVRLEAALAELDLAGRLPALLLADGRRLAARLVVGADGRRSRVRQGAAITVKSWRYPQTALVVNLDHTAPHGDTATEFHTAAGPFTLVPLAAGRSSLVCVEAPETAGALMAMDDGALALELERRAHSLLGRFSLASARQCWPMAALKADRLALPGVALIGEAAHAFPPIGAQGLNLSMRDAAALAALVGRTLEKGGDLSSPAFAAAYVAARAGDVAGRIYGVDLLNRSLLSSALPVQCLRGLGLGLARSLPPLRRLMMREGLGVAC